MWVGNKGLSFLFFSGMVSSEQGTPRGANCSPSTRGQHAEHSWGEAADSGPAPRTWVWTLRRPAEESAWSLGSAARSSGCPEKSTTLAVSCVTLRKSLSLSTFSSASRQGLVRTYYQQRIPHLPQCPGLKTSC
ncbi:uncharacterized protein [Symphalangus syndactylus]|uniref:uncharacterized protein isoform X2 n=1 Tax=Symphalangus syndactylus TaxID=9590 RepID=UPI003006C574